jgi:hypothetical protein
MKCPHLINGVLIFPKESWECPASVPGFERESNDPRSEGAWIFKPLWPTCPWRVGTVQKLPNCAQQKVEVTMTCVRLVKLLELSDCQNCIEGRKWK